MKSTALVPVMFATVVSSSRTSADTVWVFGLVLVSVTDALCFEPPSPISEIWVSPVPVAAIRPSPCAFGEPLPSLTDMAVRTAR